MVAFFWLIGGCADREGCKATQDCGSGGDKQPELVINEVLADIGYMTLNDANCDDHIQLYEDQFVEIVNVGAVEVDLDGLTINANGVDRKRFSTASLAAGAAIVVFNGGYPVFNGEGEEDWCRDLPDGVLLDTMDSWMDLSFCSPFVILLQSGDGTTIDRFQTDVSGCPAQSFVREPELSTSSDLVLHGDVSTLRMSPGTLANGSNFSGS